MAALILLVCVAVSRLVGFDSDELARMRRLVPSSRIHRDRICIRMWRVGSLSNFSGLRSPVELFSVLLGRALPGSKRSTYRSAKRLVLDSCTGPTAMNDWMANVPLMFRALPRVLLGTATACALAVLVAEPAVAFLAPAPTSMTYSRPSVAQTSEQLIGVRAFGRKPELATLRSIHDAPQLLRESRTLLATNTPCRNSFVAETLVLMADGTSKRIDRVTFGDKVMATDPDPGKTEAHEVVDLITSQGEKHLVDVKIKTKDGVRTIVATRGHPFWVDDKGVFPRAAELVGGDDLRTPEGGEVEVVSIREHTEWIRVHNLTVEGVHTYYVLAGNQPVLVHNAGGSRSIIVINPDGSSTGNITNLPAGTPVECLLDPLTGKIYIAPSGMPHEQIANRVGLGNRTDLVGGEFTPDGFGSGTMDAASGHFGQNQTPQAREQVRKTLQSNGNGSIEVVDTFC